MPPSFSLFALTIISTIVLVSSVLSAESGNTLEINSAVDLIAFSNSVNSGTSYPGTTVLLTADLYFDKNSSDNFCPIGSTLSSPFNGVFDGQGYTINNLKITKGSTHAYGLFGSSKGGRIKNAVLSSSCEVVCQIGNTPYVSGIIGECLPNEGESCSVLNSVNMARVLFNGSSTSTPLSIGGVCGQIQGIVKNCANFGTVITSETVNSAHTGGIAGSSSSFSSFIVNCINYGDIIQNGNINTLYMGGILGRDNSGATIKNCVNMGEISADGTVSGNSRIGSIVGDLSSTTTITNCYWDDAISYPCSRLDGRSGSIISNASSFNANTLQLNETITTGEYTGKSLIQALNAFALTDGNLSQWVGKQNTLGGVSFFINNRTFSLLSTGKKVVLLPDLMSEANNVFYGWFEDGCFNKPFNGTSIQEGITILYGRYGDFTPQSQQCETVSSSSSSPSSSGTTQLESSSSFSSSSPSFSSSESSSVGPTPSEYVEIIFDKKDLTEDEAIEIIKEITGNEDFEIARFEDTDEGKRVIVKFVDIEEAKEFMESAEDYKGEGKSYITRIGFIDEKDLSLSSFKAPSLLVLLLSFMAL